MEIMPQVFSKVGSIVVVLLALWLLVRWFEWKSLYFPARAITTTPEQFGLAYEDVDFVAEDGPSLHGWWIPHDEARGTIIYCHGNAGNIGDRAWLAAEMQHFGVNVFLFDYRGYGKSKGIPTEKGTYRDADAAYEVVRARYGHADEIPVILWGRSLGGAVAVDVASRRKVRGLILESTFSRTEDVAKHLYPFLPAKVICRYKYDSLDKIKEVLAPILISHGRDDEVIPIELGKQLYDAADGEKQFFELAGGHNDAGWHDTPDYATAIEKLLTDTLGPQGNQDK